MFISKKTSLLLLIAIVLFAAILRFWALGSVPPSPDWDEVALGYDAYSIMHTGRDEFGSFIPAILRSFDDYKPALYAYLAIPSVAVFGLTTFAVRFPSVVMGLLGILALYFFAKELFRSLGKEQSEILALLSALLLAISPWQIQFSRTAFETNTGLTFNLLTALFFLKGLKKPWMLLLAALIAGLNLSVYQSERVFTPLVVIALVIIYWKELIVVSKKYLIGSVIVGLITILPMLTFIISYPDSLQRIQGTSLFSQQTQVIQTTINRLKDDTDNHDVVGLVIDNRRVIYTKEIVAGYLAHFDPNWLFLEGDIKRHHAPGMGLLYLLDLPFVLLGIYFLLFGSFEKSSKFVIFSWLLLAPVPAAITFEVPHAVRTMNMLPMFILLIAIGLTSFYTYFLKNPASRLRPIGFRILIIVVFFILAGFNFTYYLNQYFVQQNYFNAYDWQYGYAQAIPQIESIKGKYKKIVVSTKTPMDESYMFFLFYLQYPPQKYQQLVARGENTETNFHQFDKYEFRNFDWSKEKVKKDILYVGTVQDFPNSVVAKKKILYPDGTAAMLIVDPKDNL